MWEAVDQTPRPESKKTEPVKLSLTSRRGGDAWLSVSVSAAVAADLGWAVGTKVGLEVGREGKVLGWVRVAPSASGRAMRALPRSTTLNVLLMPPADMARWKAESMPAPAYRVLRDGVLLAQMPWDLSGEPPAAEMAEAA